MQRTRTVTTDTYFYTAEVAQLLRVSPKTVTRWAKEGKLPFLRTIGGHRRYPEPEIRALIAALTEPVVPLRTELAVAARPPAIGRAAGAVTRGETLAAGALLVRRQLAAAGCRPPLACSAKPSSVQRLPSTGFGSWAPRAADGRPAGC